MPSHQQARFTGSFQNEIKSISTRRYGCYVFAKNCFLGSSNILTVCYGSNKSKGHWFYRCVRSKSSCDTSKCCQKFFHHYS